MALTSDKADAAFAGLVYADQALVDAEFAEIVAASLGGPPAPPPPPAPPTFPPGPAMVHLALPPSAPSADNLVFPGAWPPRGRQRSPPACTG